jgi:hypothetical protein
MYPAANPFVDWTLRDSGEGPELAYFNEQKLGTAPTIEAIAAYIADLAPLRAAEKRAVDLDAGAERLQYISGGDGQELVYQRKAEEARRLLAALAADPGYVADLADYPMLAAGIGFDGATLAECAALVAARDTAWTQIAAAIDLIRRTARAAIDAAADEAAIMAVRPAIHWLEA